MEANNAVLNIDDSYIKHIVRAKENNRLVIFLGAGFSKSVNPNMPCWNNIVNGMKSELGDNISEDETDYLKIAQLYYLKFGEYNYLKDIKDYFTNECVEINESILEELFYLNPNTIVTTNWDNILEQYTYDNLLQYDVIANDTELLTSNLDNKVIKMHGCINKHNMVFKEADYLSYEDNFPVITNYIKNLLTSNTILFLGFGYSDPNIKKIFNWLPSRYKVKPPIYLLENESKPIYTEYFKNLGIHLITSNHYAIDTLLKKLNAHSKNIDQSIIYNIKKYAFPNIQLSLDSIKKITHAYGTDFNILTVYANQEIYNEYKSIKESNANTKTLFEFMINNHIRKILVIGMNHNDKKENISFETSDEKKFQRLDKYLFFCNADNSYTTIYEKFGVNKLVATLREDYLKAKKEHNYLGLLIISHNYSLVKCLRGGYTSQKISQYNLNNTFLSINNSVVQKRYIDDYLALSKFHDIEKSKVTTLLDKIYKDVKTIDNGGMVSKTSYAKEQTSFYFYLLFIYENNSLLPIFNEFYEISKKYLLISIFRQKSSKSKVYKLTHFDVFSFINQHSNTYLELYDLLEIKNMKIEIYKPYHHKLLRIGSNLLKAYIDKYKVSNMDSIESHRLTNFIYLVSCTQLNKRVSGFIISRVLNAILDLPFRPYNKVLEAINTLLYKVEQIEESATHIFDKYIGYVLKYKGEFPESPMYNLISAADKGYKYQDKYNIMKFVDNALQKDLRDYVNDIDMSLFIYELLNKDCLEQYDRLFDEYDFSNAALDFDLLHIFTVRVLLQVGYDNRTFPNEEDILDSLIKILKEKGKYYSYKHLYLNLKKIREMNLRQDLNTKIDELTNLLNHHIDTFNKAGFGWSNGVV